MLIQELNKSRSFDSIVKKLKFDLKIYIFLKLKKLPNKLKECTKLGGKCATSVDAYYYLVIGFTIVGIIWLLIFSRCLAVLNNTPKSKWSLFRSHDAGDNLKTTTLK